MRKIIDKVFQLSFQDKSMFLSPPLPVSEAVHINLSFNGKPRGKSWKPVKIEMVKFDEFKKPLIQSDIMDCFGAGFAFGSNVKERIGKTLEQFGEILPLDCPETKFWVFNPTIVLDALDEDNSDVERFSPGGRIMFFKKYFFRPEILVGKFLFLINQRPTGPTFATESFAELIKVNKFTGLDFMEVWPSDKRPFKW